MPDQKITLNLDTVERERTYEPYVVGLPGGQTMTLVDPQELASDDLLSTDKPVEMLRLCVRPEDKKHLRTLLELPAWKLNLLLEDFMKHYGLDKLGNGSGSRGF